MKQVIKQQTGRIVRAKRIIVPARKETFKEYSELYQQVQQLQERMEALKPTIMNDIKASGEKTLKTDFGSFQRVETESWTYSKTLQQKVKVLTNEIEAMKARARALGRASKKEGAYLRYFEK